MTDPRIEAAARAIAEIDWPMFEWAEIHDDVKSDLYQYARVALAAADAAAWRPIESAPRDGTLILVAVKHIGCDVVSWWGAGWRETTNGLMLRDDPTHWQPLPSPPTPPEPTP